MAIKSIDKTKKPSATTSINAGIVKVAGIQMASGPNVAANLSEAERLIEIAVDQGAKLVVLPEYFSIMGLKDTDKVEVAEKEGDGPIQHFLYELAKKHDVWIVAGSIPLQAKVAGKVRNACLVYDNAGRVVARYDKIHLFGFERGEESFDESRTIAPGSEVVVLDSPLGRVGLSVCYDLRFPELYRAMGECSLLVVPSAFTYTTGRAHWEILLRGRAIENQCYVLAAAQGGQHENGRRTWGHSMLIDPWGEIVAQHAEGEAIVMGRFDPDQLQSVRASLPALKHKKL